jgi:23S rRNA (uridine2552-2'-O)-methyltransferase
MEIDDKDKLIRPGMVVVDLGAAPGSWSQVAIKRVGTTVACLRSTCSDGADPRVSVHAGDFHDEEFVHFELLEGRAVDLVMSDIAPNISGIPTSDQAGRSILPNWRWILPVSIWRQAGAFW